MNVLRRAMESALEHDPILVTLVGYEFEGDSGEPRRPNLFEDEAPPGTEAPYGVWFIIPGGTPEGTFHEQDSIQPKLVQFTSWGRDRNEAWAIFEAAHYALTHYDMGHDLTPYTTLGVVKTGDEHSEKDNDTGWFQVPATFRITIAR